MNRIRIQHEDFDIAQECATLQGSRQDIGAIVSFVGLVRDRNTGEPVQRMFLEHYPGMTERQLEDIVAAAEARWELQGVTVIHRVGELQPGDQIVLVLTASAHRADAYNANAYIMDYLKTRATFWKQEQTADGRQWVESRDSDEAAARRWESSGDRGC